MHRNMPSNPFESLIPGISINLEISMVPPCPPDRPGSSIQEKGHRYFDDGDDMDKLIKSICPVENESEKPEKQGEKPDFNNPCESSKKDDKEDKEDEDESWNHS